MARSTVFRSHRLIATVLAGVLALACGLVPIATSGAPPGGAPAKLAIDSYSDPGILDPGTQWGVGSIIIYRNIFDQFLRRDPATGKIGPGIATAWKALNPTTWQFTVRDGIKFTDGTALTAEDAAFSLKRILDPSLKSAQYANYSDVDTVSAKGNVVTIVTKSPDPLLLQYLTILSVVPEAYVQQHGDAYFNLHPVGSGPYTLESWNQGANVTLARNDTYWGKKGAFAEVEYRVVTNDATRLADLQSGVADLALSLTPDDVGTLQSSPALKALVVPSEFVQLLFFNTYQAPTNSLQVRQAVGYALNIPLLLQTVLKGFGKPVRVPLSPVVFGYDPSGPGTTFDPAKARQLLSEARYSGAPLVMLASAFMNPDLVQAIQSELADVGLNMSIQNVPGPTYLLKVQNPQHNWGNVTLLGWSCSCGDAGGLLYPVFYSKSIWSSWSDPSFDQYISAAQSTLVARDRLRAFHSALGVIAQQVPAVGMYQQESIYGANAHLVWTPNPQSNIFLNEMGWK
jgi:peptide/nickel transport system substrate-binding protein